MADYLARRFPNLMNTYTVRSGLCGTPHIYWRVNFPVKSQSVLGGDLKAEGSYVVGAGSEIAGCVWQVENDRPIRSITQSELKQVLTALRPTRTTHQSTIYE